MSIKADEVKKLREKTGAGMMDCKKALGEAGGDMEKAAEVLRKWGMAVAGKKINRVAADGTIGYFVSDNNALAVMVEINCETDFVVKTPDFQKYVSTVTQLVKEKNPNDLKALLSLSHNGTTVEEEETQLVAKIGEKLGVRRFVRWQMNSPAEKIAQYIHAGSKIGVFVRFNDPNLKLTNSFAREVAMHIAAMNPQYIRKEDIPESVLVKEREIIGAQMGEQKKPPEILEKIINGKLGKYYSEVCLENQIFVRDPEGKTTVGQAVSKIEPNIRIEKFVRFQVGEGIEKR